MVHQAAKLEMQLSESDFPFSKRMRNFFTYVGLSTVKDLTLIPLATFVCFRGFKARCRQELLAFIEFEGIEDLFEGFSQWKNDTKQPPATSRSRQ